MGRRRVYPSDLTDEQWEIIEPILPLIKEPGRIPKHPFRDIVDAILYLDRSGCSWRQLPVDFPPWQTVYAWFKRWKARGVTERILDELREQIRLAEGRNAEPSAGVIDSQSVKAADTVSRDTRGYDAGKKINGRKRFVITDTLGPLVSVTVPAASWQDRDGAKTIYARRSGSCSPTRASGCRGARPGRPHPSNGDRHRAQAARAARVRGSSLALGGGTDVGLADRPPPVSP